MNKQNILSLVEKINNINKIPQQLKRKAWPQFQSWMNISAQAWYSKGTNSHQVNKKKTKRFTKWQDHKEDHKWQDHKGTFCCSLPVLFERKQLWVSGCSSKSIHRRENISQLKTGGYKLVQMWEGRSCPIDTCSSHTPTFHVENCNSSGDTNLSLTEAAKSVSWF